MATKMLIGGTKFDGVEDGVYADVVDGLLVLTVESKEADEVYSKIILGPDLIDRLAEYIWNSDIRRAKR